MSASQLYIAAYDVRDPSRLRQALYVLKDFASGGQKSVFECYLTPAEKRLLLSRIREVINENIDAFLLVRLPAPHRIEVLGQGILPLNDEWMIIG
ncbi:CRISPR-associated protein Cas2 [Pokkaliibacter plantistimulans]|uniref:CRISPR-associated endoribonuclease Cas2 n=1 Tax=Pokkaliibacter plantistimulans TaxID=1635171 RepID=A0ABX5LTS8_9GAMM|nr:CRISPR-associated endonuclease Cas2 [Pokkaliibacter plantistimulans]PXF28686.1 CRISPR-associated protein Cas2 [Pokkaliibacter plantistimulans]